MGTMTSNRDWTGGDLVLRPFAMQPCMLFLALVRVCALLIVGTDSSKATSLGSWSARSLQRFASASWRGARLEFGTPAQSEQGERTNIMVAVTDAETGKPINQARLTLEFTEPGDPSKLKRSKKLSYSAKTNAQGHYKFPSLPKGTIRLIVTAERHQTFSKEFELEKENQVIEVKLKKPQP